MSINDFPPDPPIEFPPARTVQVRGRGEFFIRDSALLDPDRDSKPVVLLLHGWIATSDLNWAGSYQALIDAGYRVIGIDHRGHGRGLRPLIPFTLVDCAADAAGVLRALNLSQVVVIGYSMGGAIAQLVARDHPDVTAGVVLSGTAQHWQEPGLRRAWKALGVVGVVLRLAPGAFWTWGFKRVGFRSGPQAAWLRSEMLRHSPAAIVQAGRELSRFDSRPWLRRLPVPSAVVVTTRDTAVPPWKQYELAQALEAQVLESPIEHLEVTTAGAPFNDPLLQAIAAVRGVSAEQAA
jgi:3-oxoadipate enol-lactonase